MQINDSIIFNEFSILFYAIVCIVLLTISATMYLKTKSAKYYEERQEGAFSFIARWVDTPKMQRPAGFIVINVMVLFFASIFAITFYMISGEAAWFGTPSDNFVFLSVMGGFIAGIIAISLSFLVTRFKG